MPITHPTSRDTAAEFQPLKRGISIWYSHHAAHPVGTQLYTGTSHTASADRVDIIWRYAIEIFSESVQSGPLRRSPLSAALRCSLPLSAALCRSLPLAAARSLPLAAARSLPLAAEGDGGDGLSHLSHG